MKRILAVLVAVLALSACSFPGSPLTHRGTVGAPGASGALLKGEHCADLLVTAFINPKPVAGAFKCQNATEQQAAISAGVTDDASIAGFFDFTSAIDVGSSPGGAFLYEIQSKTYGTEILVVWTDNDGLVSHFSQSTKP